MRNSKSLIVGFFTDSVIKLMILKLTFFTFFIDGPVQWYHERATLIKKDALSEGNILP